MDLESGKDDLSIEDGNLVVFTGLACKVSSSIGRKCAKGTNMQYILDGAVGAIRPGRLTFILGPSGAGKTTLLKILAGRKKTGVTGSLYGTGRNAVLVPQNSTLIDTLTAKEALKFAAALKLPNATKREQKNTILNVTTQLGISDVLHRMTDQLSGGERKRLTIACELLTDPTVMLLDEPTSGLDTVSSISVARALLNIARSGRTVACVVHQPSSKLFTMADDVIVLAEGRTLCAGAVTDIPETLMKAGFTCPQYYNVADFLLEVASNEHPGNKAILESEASSYAHEMSKIARNDTTTTNGKGASPEAQALLLRPYKAPRVGYLANYWQQFCALIWRSCIGVLRDVHLTQIRLTAHLVVALLLGALYNGAGEEASRVMTNTSCLFFFLLFLFFSNAMPTIHTFPVEATVVLQEHLNKWYSLITYCASKIIVDLPIQLLCATAFFFPAWSLTSQPIEWHRMSMAWIICALTTILAQTFGLVVGAAFDLKLGLFVIPAANIPMLMFSEFFIPYHEMPVYLRPFAAISYFRYAFDALLNVVYGYDRPPLSCNKPFCMFRNPAKYLDHLGLTLDFQRDIIVLSVWIVVLQLLLVFVLYFRVYRACR